MPDGSAPHGAWGANTDVRQPAQPRKKPGNSGLAAGERRGLSRRSPARGFSPFLVCFGASPAVAGEGPGIAFEGVSRLLVQRVETWTVLERPVGPTLPEPQRSLTFISGPENHFAHQVAARLVRSAGSLRREPAPFSPIVVHGPPEVGKSFWMHLLATEFRSRIPASLIRVTQAADWIRLTSPSKDRREEVPGWEPFRQLRVLFMDGLDLLVERLPAQQALTQLLDEYQASGALAIFTSTDSPLQSRLQNRLVSRLAAGLTVPLVPPGPETREVILRNLIERRGWSAGDAQVRRFAGCNAGSVTQLRAALLQASRDLPAGCRDLSGVLRLRRQAPLDAPRVPLRSIMSLVSRHFLVSFRDLTGSSRRRTCVLARGVAMLLARSHTHSSLQEIGQVLGERDHSTVLNAIRRTQRRMDQDPTLRESVQRMSETLRRQMRQREV